MSIERISNGEIEGILCNTFRHYLVGNFPEASLKDDNVEVGISNYLEFTCDKPHYHSEITEYQMVLSGESRLFDLELKKEYILNAGDFFIVKPFTYYAEKHKAGTRVLFFKYPGKNDKVLLEVSDDLQCWLDNDCFTK